MGWGRMFVILRYFPAFMTCPHYHFFQTSRMSSTTDLGYPVFRCRACRRKFNERTGTPFDRLKFSTDIVLQVVLWRFRSSLLPPNTTQRGSHDPLLRCSFRAASSDTFFKEISTEEIKAQFVTNRKDDIRV